MAELVASRPKPTFARIDRTRSRAPCPLNAVRIVIWLPQRDGYTAYVLVKKIAYIAGARKSIKARPSERRCEPNEPAPRLRCWLNHRGRDIRMQPVNNGRRVAARRFRLRPFAGAMAQSRCAIPASPPASVPRGTRLSGARCGAAPR